MRKDNLYLVTIKRGNGNTETLHMQASSLLYATQRAHDYFDATLTPGTYYDIISVTNVGQIAIIDYSLKP